MEALRILCFLGRGKDTQIFLRLKTEVGVTFGKIFFLLLHISTKLALGRKNTSFYCLGNEEIHQKWLLKCSVAHMFGVVGGQQFGVKDLQQPQKPPKKRWL